MSDLRTDVAQRGLGSARDSYYVGVVYYRPTGRLLHECRLRLDRATAARDAEQCAAVIARAARGGAS